VLTWARGIIGVVMVLIGAVWVGQGLDLIKGSFMTGQAIWALIGIVVLLAGVWLLWGLRATLAARRTS
jgi:hypothetical protein